MATNLSVRRRKLHRQLRQRHYWQLRRRRRHCRWPPRHLQRQKTPPMRSRQPLSSALPQLQLPVPLQGLAAKTQNKRRKQEQEEEKHMRRRNFIREGKKRTFFASFWKCFCAWVRICTTVRVGMVSAIFFHSRPYVSRPSMNNRCSSSLHRPAHRDRRVRAKRTNKQPEVDNGPLRGDVGRGKRFSMSKPVPWLLLRLGREAGAEHTPSGCETRRRRQRARPVPGTAVRQGGRSARCRRRTAPHSLYIALNSLLWTVAGQVAGDAGTHTPLWARGCRVAGGGNGDRDEAVFTRPFPGACRPLFRCAAQCGTPKTRCYGGGTEGRRRIGATRG